MHTTVHALSPAKLPGCSTSLSPSIIHPKTFILPHNSVPFQSPKNLLIQLRNVRIRARKQRSLGALNASGAEGISSTVEERWLLEPVGDGDSRHIGFKVKMPDAFEIASSEVTVGRLPEKADMVIPVATVSALHAHIQKKAGNLLVTDLDSTNGTFINGKRLRPGVAVAASAGSFITFGDIHLAMFRISKLENMEVAPEESQNKEADSPNESNETTS